MFLSHLCFFIVLLFENTVFSLLADCLLLPRRALVLDKGAEYHVPIKVKKKNTVNNLKTLSYKTTLDLFTIQSHVTVLNLHNRYVSLLIKKQKKTLPLLVGGKIGIILTASRLETGQDA